MIDKKDSSEEAHSTVDNEKIYRLLVDSIKDYAIFMLNPDGVILTWNAGAARIKGYTAGDIIGKHFSIFYPPEVQQTGWPQQELKIAIREGRFEETGWRVRRDGSLFWANVVITPAYESEGGELTGFFKVTRDLTERKRLEDELVRSNHALRESEERYRLLLDGAQDYAILMLTREGNVVTWNGGAERMKGYAADEIIGQHFSVFYPEQAVEEGFPQYELRKALENGRFEDEGWRVRRDRSLFWANVVITPLYNHEQVHIGYSKITRDLSQRLRNDELKRKNQELLRINTDLDNFIYTASHDLKAPIANLEGLLNVLVKKLEGRPHNDEQGILRMMDLSIGKLKQTIQGLTEITRAQRGQEESPESLSIGAVWDDVKEELATVIADAGAKVEADLAVDRLVLARANLRSLLYNLLSNAIKFRDPARPLRVQIRTQLEAEHLVLSVSDNGLGLRPEQQARLFSMFRRFHPHTEGTGVGLYIVKRIVENHNGRIEVQSEADRGSTFTMYFPLNGA